MLLNFFGLAVANQFVRPGIKIEVLHHALGIQKTHVGKCRQPLYIQPGIEFMLASPKC